MPVLYLNFWLANCKRALKQISKRSEILLENVGSFIIIIIQITVLIDDDNVN